VQRTCQPAACLSSPAPCPCPCRWIDRCINAHLRPTEQNLFAIIQGGLDPRLREISLEQLIQRDTPGFAIGGLAGGESKDHFWRVVSQCTAALPANKPRYVMGIGYPLDVVVCSALGADMYDSVYPTRTARFGVALTPQGTLRLKHARMAQDFRPLDDTCSCMVCKKYTRAYLHNVVTKGLASASVLVTYHNVAYMQSLTRRMRQSIVDQKFPEFVGAFLKDLYPKGEVPQWVCDAMEAAEISLEGVATNPVPTAE
jgi:tRNA-guanine family transglycosylase